MFHVIIFRACPWDLYVMYACFYVLVIDAPSLIFHIFPWSVALEQLTYELWKLNLQIIHFLQKFCTTLRWISTKILICHNSFLRIRILSDVGTNAVVKVAHFSVCGFSSIRRTGFVLGIWSYFFSIFLLSRDMLLHVDLYILLNV